MKRKKLLKFRIYTNTRFGVGCTEIKAIDFIDAFSRLSKDYKERCFEITNIDSGETKSKNEIINI